MVIKYSAPQLIAIGELVILKECISKASDRYEMEPQYHPVYMPPTNAGQDPIYANNNIAKIPSNSISANNFLEDYAQFQHHLSQSILHNRDIHLHLQPANHAAGYDQQRQQQLSESVAEFFKNAQQNFRPVQDPINQPDSTSTAVNRARRLSEVEAELLAQLRGHIHV